MSVEQAAPPTAPVGPVAGAGTDVTQTAPAPAGSAAAPDIATAPLPEVRAYLKRRDSEATVPSATAQVGVAPGGPETSPERQAGLPGEAAAPVAPEGDEPTAPQARGSRQRRAAPSADLDPAVLQRQNASLAGNLQQLQAQRQAEQAAFTQQQQELARLQTQMVEQERRQFQAEVATLPHDVQQRAIAEYDNQRRAEQHQRDLTQYHGYLEQVKQTQDQREQQLTGLTRQLELADQRAALPAMFGAYAPFLAEKYGVSPEYMQQVVQSESVQQAMALYTDERHALLIGETLAAIAEVEGKRVAAERQANAAVASRAGVHRSEYAVGAGGGMAEVERIRTMPPAEFTELRAQMRRQAGQRTG